MPVQHIPLPAASQPTAEELAQYDLGDTNAVDEPASAQPAAPSPINTSAFTSDVPSSAAPLAPSTPPRDPETGRFVPAESAPLPTKYDHGVHLTKLATELGFSPGEIESTDPETLHAAVYRANRAVHQRHADLLRELQINAGNSAPTNTPLAPQAPVPEPEPEMLGDAFSNPEEWAPAFRDELKKFVEPLVKEIRDLKKANSMLMQGEQIRQREERYNVLDQCFNEHPETYGTGTRQQMKPNSRELKRRSVIVQQLESMKDAPGTFKQKFDFLHDAMYGTDKPATPAEPAPAPSPAANGRRFTPEQYQNGAVLQPTDRKGGKEPQGPKLAERNVTLMMREQGLLEDTGADDATLDGFLPADGSAP